MTPTEPNFTFTPASATLVINGANASANFSAVDLAYSNRHLALFGPVHSGPNC